MGAQRLPGGRRSVPPQQILSLHVKCVGPQFPRPPKKLRSGSPVSAFIC